MYLPARSPPLLKPCTHLLLYLTVSSRRLRCLPCDPRSVQSSSFHFCVLFLMPAPVSQSGCCSRLCCMDLLPFTTLLQAAILPTFQAGQLPASHPACCVITYILQRQPLRCCLSGGGCTRRPSAAPKLTPSQDKLACACKELHHPTHSTGGWQPPCLPKAADTTACP